MTRTIKLDEVIEELQALKEENEFLQKQNKALKIRCSDYCLRVNKLECEIQDMKFTHKMLNSEEAGRAFARELLGKPMTEEDLKIADAENNYIPYTAEDF